MKSLNSDGRQTDGWIVHDIIQYLGYPLIIIGKTFIMGNELRQILQTGSFQYSQGRGVGVII